MKNTASQKGFSSLIVLLIVLGVIAVGSGTYFLSRPNVPISQQPSKSPPAQEQSQAIITPAGRDKPRGDLTLALKRSPLSAPEGLLDIYWGRKLQHVLAKPLDLIDGVAIANNTNQTLLLKKVVNENREGIKTELPGRATPIYLLPERFIKNGEEEIICKARDIFASTINNICEFTVPLEIKAGEKIILQPELFAVRNGSVDRYSGLSKLIAEDTLFINRNKDREKAVFANQAGESGYLFLQQNSMYSGGYQASDYVANKATFNIGGFIYGDVRNQELLDKIFPFEDSQGEKVAARIGNVATGTIVQVFSLPKNMPGHNNFSEDTLQIQAFLYKLGWLADAKQITGFWNYVTTNALKTFQRSVYLSETGAWDSATSFVARNIFAYYYGEGGPSIILGTGSDAQYFAIYDEVGDIKGKYIINPVIAPSVNSIKENKLLMVSGETKESHGGLRIVNTSNKEYQCTLQNVNGQQINQFVLPINGFYELELHVEQAQGVTTESDILNCGGKKIEIERIHSHRRG